MNATQTEEEIFFHAMELTSWEERKTYLHEVCAGNADLRMRVEALLRRHEESDGVLDSPPPGFSGTIESLPPTEQPGTIIGSYKLLQQIGEGGMGVVFMAEQTWPIQRTIALKIIKLGMDTRQVIARFEAERQALAIMDHPNIAKVVDAGTTKNGRPYFAMELVKGVPIIAYCDQEQLSIHQRLELVIAVCQAVEHAHQKGIIHRDLKPSNVLVAEYDGKPVPKIIDFGVAKATAQRLTEKTMFTQYGQLIGTFEYMSPEQARF
ncbi:MAG TPA: serine/threonine-protein kinase, partial [Lacipirellulaceae bacterium]|nr:serine/threonine-protein kinase [Lacipirellulaceae bacterium]